MKINRVAVYFFISSAVVTLWIVLYDVAHYLLTEKYFVYHHLPVCLGLVLLVALLFSVTLTFEWLLQKLRTIKIAWLAFGILFFLSLGVFMHMQYQKYYSRLQHFPKIQRVTKNWTIQGDKVAIYGKNFGQAWQQGNVKLNDFEYQLVSWDDRRIVIEQPAINQPQKGELVITNHYGYQAKVTNFEIKDPGEVLR